MNSNEFDLCVVGAGMIGSAAACHAAQWGRVCLVGPEEPKTRHRDDGRDIYGAHYDEGRLTRCLDPDPVWATLAQESIARYRELEQKSGVKFYNEVGFLVIGKKQCDYMENVKNVAKEQKLNVKTLDYSGLMKEFPYLNVSKDDFGIRETHNAGNISPRNLVEAQITLAKARGCRYISEVVEEVQREVKNGEYIMVVKTKSEKITAKKVLLATGAFTAFRNILPPGIEINLHPRPIEVAKVEISEGDALKLRGMPGMIYNGTGASDWSRTLPRDKKNFIHWYMLPPIKYPDGKFYLKLGYFYENGQSDAKTLTLAEIKDWFCGYGGKRLVDANAELITNVIQGVKKLSHHGDFCVITETPTERPFIDMIHSQLGVALGGNGYAAKSSDEIGRIAAAMIMKDTWDSTIPKDVFKVQFKNTKSNL